jgi:hypothetical protein
MRITEMSTAQFASAACDLLEPVSRIADTPEIYAAIERLSKGAADGESPIAYMVNGIKDALPALLKTHFDDLIAILSVFTEKPVQELRDQNILITMKQIYEYIIMDVLKLNKNAA